MRKESGFTIVELIVIIAIFTIMASTAVPAWVTWLPSHRLKSASREMFESFQQAKLEAVRRNVNVAISFDPDNDGNISDEYTMFVDDGDGAGGVVNDFIQNGTELLLGRFNMPNKVTLVSANFSGNQSAGFNSRGLPANNQIGRVTLNNTKGISREIRLSMAGNIRIHKP